MRSCYNELKAWSRGQPNCQLSLQSLTSPDSLFGFEDEFVRENRIPKSVQADACRARHDE